jgi:hypothetical protein
MVGRIVRATSGPRPKASQKVTADDFRAAWATKETVAQMARQLGVSHGACQRRAYRMGLR